jgi:signal transduction histidine kinase
MGLPVVGLIVKMIRLAWQIWSFLVSALAGISVSRRKKASRPTVVTMEQEAQFHARRGEQDEQLRDNFLFMASHELKTPMTTIVGQTQLALRRLSKVPDLSIDVVAMRAALESINDQTHRLNSIVDEILDLYNLRAGKVQLRLETCDLVDICHKVVEEQRLLTGRRIDLEALAPSVFLQGDADRLSQVLTNLVNNAIKYSPEDTPVQVLVEQHHDIGIIEVKDFGQGIPYGLQTHIFEPFYRTPDASFTSKGGLGLGLAICKNVVERHGGRIWCRSHPGKGSTFIVEVPLNGHHNKPN